MKKTMGLWDIVFINVTAIIGLRWLPIAAGYGASAPLLWFIAAMLFFVPLGFVSSELATAWPDEGGLYVWVKEAYGEKPAFLVSWFYWINSFFYWPSLFTFIAVTIVFLIDPILAKNKYFICSSVLIGLWIITLINMRSIGAMKWLSKLGGVFGILLPGVLIIGLGFFGRFVLGHPTPTDYSWGNWLPSFGTTANIAMLSTLMFSMSGIELTPILAGETRDPQKTFPRATLISAILITLIYIIGTASITFIIAPEKIGAASGIMDALHLISNEIGFPIIAMIVAGMIVLGGIGGACIWLVVPIKMFFESCKNGVLPKYFVRLNKNDMPANAMLTQAIVVSVIVVFTAVLPSVNVFYETLVIMATITYFIPYLVMFLAFMRLRKIKPHQPRPYRIPGGKVMAWLVTCIGMFSVSLAIVLPFCLPPADIASTHDVLMYRLELVFGALMFGVLGYLIYALYEKRQKAKSI